MNILLIYPKFPQTFWSFSFALPFVGKKSAFPPLGLLTVAALLPKHFQLRLIDMNVDSLNDTDLSWADLAFISAMTVQRESVERVIGRCQRSGLKIVAGGPLFTSMPGKFGQVDHLVLGEAEATLPAFLEDLKKGSTKSIYRASEFPDIRSSPAPLWKLINIRHYAALCIQYSRGCPFNCEFCNITSLFGRSPRNKSPGQIVLELNAIYKIGWRGSVFFVDDNFIGNKRILKKQLLPELILWRLKKKGCPFLTETSINLADDPELLCMMVKAGFDSVFIGIETPHDESLAECQKKHNRTRDLLQDIKTIQRSGLQVMGGFIVGFDNDPPSIFQRQVDFIQQTGIVTAMVGLLQAPPGTRLFRRLKKANRISRDFSGDNVGSTTNIIPSMGLEKLNTGYQSIMRQLYAPKNYYKRIRVFLSEIKRPSVIVSFDIQRLHAFWRASLHLGILGKERVQFWKLMTWALTHRPRLLPLAVTLAIYGYHYRRICELHVFK